MIMTDIYSPPWQQKIFSSTIAAIGKQLKQSVKVFHSLMLYRLLPVKYNTKQFHLANNGTRSRVFLELKNYKIFEKTSFNLLFRTPLTTSP